MSTTSIPRGPGIRQFITSVTPTGTDPERFWRKVVNICAEVDSETEAAFELNAWYGLTAPRARILYRVASGRVGEITHIDP
ncbi:hypothetical protein CC117_00700 [Parafrankia colletiae]|uniref:Uncharacterized protein n=1 Tax=Parafrankia colletiae TaxID=573497 RepID=A0A1S1RHF3_9ACTN|nr:hypothetical protein [Parafrankia colletiae]MCK9904355.1 hypothetical protein [Frankia sp. Cpl3]OHV46208.1 hypothetical protein CC117_00700 [Parafrankia colletiae]